MSLPGATMFASHATVSGSYAFAQAKGFLSIVHIARRVRTRTLCHHQHQPLNRCFVPAKGVEPLTS